jgi:hypothetical protein
MLIKHFLDLYFVSVLRFTWQQEENGVISFFNGICFQEL